MAVKIKADNLCKALEGFWCLVPSVAVVSHYLSYFSSSRQECLPLFQKLQQKNIPPCRALTLIVGGEVTQLVQSE